MDTVSVERVIPAPAEALFEVLADPARHPEIDGSGTVRRLRWGGGRLRLGSRFGMAMKLGVPYFMENTVVELDPPRLIAWRTTGPTALGRLLGGRVWRYELESTGSGTRVKQTWDISGESPLTKPLVRLAAARTAQAMAATLERLEALTSQEASSG